jgi:hypothetical protein
MRQLASFLLVALAVPALAADIWRWKDERGVIHYSDTPMPGAERVAVTTAPPPAGSSNNPPSSAPPAAPPAAPPFAYSSCAIEAPGNDQVFNAVNTITASLQISPPLQDDHSIRVILDGNPYSAWPDRMLVFKLENLERGTHTLAVQVVGADRKIVCDGAPVTFHVRQPSVLTPNRNKPKP